MQFGRKPIYADVEEITDDNIMQVLRDAVIEFSAIKDDCIRLLNYEKGMQGLHRVKTYRSDIDCVCIDNVANEIVEFKTAFNWGSPITLIQRGEKDSGESNESEAISLLNECYEAEKMGEKEQELARYVEICGIGFTFVDINTEYEDGDSYFKIDVLDPRYAFIVRSSRHFDHRPILGVTFREYKGNRYYTCFSKDRRYEIINAVKMVNGKPKMKNGEPVTTWETGYGNGDMNPLGRIPIIEWIRSHDRMGCFERQISELDNLNLLVSDFSNDVDQNCQAIWHGNDIDFPKDENGNTVYPETNDWIITRTTQDGKTPFVNPLAVAYDYSGMLDNIVTRRSLILQKCNVPVRNDDSGGSTGIAMSQATGLANAEYEATKQSHIKEGCKIEELKSVLAAIRECSATPKDSPLRKLRYIDIKPHVERQKNFEMATKINTFATGVSHGIAPKWMFAAINMFDDPNQVAEDSEPYMKKYLDSIYKTQESGDSQSTDSNAVNNDRLQTDDSDQISNSPFIDGIKTKDNSQEQESEEPDK